MLATLRGRHRIPQFAIFAAVAHSGADHRMEYRDMAQQKQLLIAAAVLGLALGAAGCNRQEPTAEVREDVAEAQQDANEEVADQQADAVASNDGSLEDRAEADYDVAIAKADGDRKVAEEACEALSGDAQENCKQTAEQQYDAAKADAQSQLDAARNSGGAVDSTYGTDATGAPVPAPGAAPSTDPAETGSTGG